MTLGANRTVTVTSSTLTVGGAIAGSAFGLTKAGAGTLVLGGANTYTNATTVSAGQLHIAPSGSINSTPSITVNGAGAEFKYNSATALSQPLTLTRGTLSGTGTINTPVSIGDNFVLSPGNSPGTQTYQSGTFAGGGSYTWEINNWASGTAGVNYDQAIFTNGLTITSSSASPFTINLTSLKADNTGGAVPGFNSGLTGLSIAIATGSMTGFSPSAFTLGTSSFFADNTVSGSAGGGFWLSTNSGSNQLILNYAPSARYTLSATPAESAIYAGGSTVITGSITNSTADRSGADSMQFSSLSVGTGSLSVTSGTLASGAGTTGTVGFSSGTVGQFTFTPTVSASNVNLGTAALAGASTSGTVTVWNPAAVNSLSGTVNFGTVLKGTTLSQSLSITNTAPAGGYTEALDATFGTVAGGATTNAGSISLLAAGSTSTAMGVGLVSSAAGLQSGSVQVTFTSNGSVSGLGTASIAPQMMNLTGTVLDPAVASFTSGSIPSTSLTLTFGSVNEGESASQGFNLYNLLQTAGFTADLELISINETNPSGPFSTNLTLGGFNDIAPGSSSSWQVLLNSGGQGTFSNTWTLEFKSANGGAVYTGDTAQALTLTANVIIVPEPGALALAGAGIALAGWAAIRRRK